jgi:hypothetical protein
VCLLVVASVSLICLLGISSVYALNQNEASVSLSWSSNIYYQGDSGTVTIFFDSGCPEELKISWIGIHFDWMATDVYNTLGDVPGDSVSIPSDGSYTFNPISFSIPSDASVGSHSYFVKINGKQHGLWWYDVSWSSPSSMLQVHDAYEKIYNQLYPQVSSKISDAQNANYNSPEAKSLFQQANEEFNLANSLANQGKWQDAVTHLQSASSLADQASAKEQTIQQTGNQQLIIIIGAVILAIILVAIGALIVQKKRSQKHAP